MTPTEQHTATGWPCNCPACVTDRIEQGAPPRVKGPGSRQYPPCPTPLKVRYNDRPEAEQALFKVQYEAKPGHLERRAYQCVCGRWHLTKMWAPVISR